MRSAVLLALLSLPVSAQTAAQVCAKILYADQRVACVRTIAGHAVEPEAAQVCGGILYADQIVQCLSGTLDKHYEPDELDACRTILFADQRSQCMAAAGVKARSRREREDDDFEEERPRRRQDDGDRPRFDSTVTFENRTSRATVVRYFWRWAGRGAWTEFGNRRRLAPGREVSLESTSGLFDYCVETSDRRSARWPRIRLDGNEHRLWFTSDALEDVDCRDR